MGIAERLALDEIAVGVRFFCKIPSFLRHPLTLDEARDILRRDQEQREANFLALVRRAVYREAGSPYRRLLALAGCEYGDLEHLVTEQGVEGGLAVLYRHGVYLTVEEFKGRKPAVRGSATIEVEPARLRNPGVAVHLIGQTGGSRGPRTPVPIDLATIRDGAVDTLLALHARGGLGWHHALWSVPGASTLRRLLRYSVFGAPPVRWFSQVDAAAPGLHPRYRWSARALRWGGLLAGVRLPRPLHVPLDDPLPIARWMRAVLEAGGTPHLYTFVSSAVRLAEAAFEAGIELRGAQLQVGGEPITRARLATIGRTGAEPWPSYGATETGAFGRACLAPAAPDDIHLLGHRLAVVQAGPAGAAAGLPPLALLVSSVRPTARLVLLNVSIGDQAVVVSRQCGCPMERFGWTTHLHSIRSFEKLTAGGMTFLDADMVRLLDEVLPARFGGCPTDYQLVEDEAEDGRARLRLLIHPRLGPLDAREVVGTLLREIGAGSGVEHLVGLVWRGQDLVRVERTAPQTTAAGKILHLHIERRVHALENPASVASGAGD